MLQIVLSNEAVLIYFTPNRREMSPKFTQEMQKSNLKQCTEKQDGWVVVVVAGGGFGWVGKGHYQQLAKSISFKLLY